MSHLLEIKNLSTEFIVNGDHVQAVEGISFHIDPGEIIAIVGESGSGKSVSQLSVMQLITKPGNITGGEVLLNGENMLAYGAKSERVRQFRGGDVGIIFQEPMTALNPVFTVGYQIQEAILNHKDISKEEAQAQAVSLMKKLGIPDAETRFNYYPDQFSGGMRQRICVAMAMASEPKVLIADEATTALDVTTQAQLLDMLKDIVVETHTALIIVTHNLGVVARYAERIYVMYAGSFVEEGRIKDVFGNPTHPYTKGLLKAIPHLEDPKDKKLIPIDGFLPNLADKPQTCIFEPRCPFSCDRCKQPQRPGMKVIDGDHKYACWLSCEEIAEKNEKIYAQLKPSAKHSPKENHIIDVKNLSMHFDVTKGFFKKKIGEVSALDDVSFYVREGETLGIVGESGCGKTTLARCLLRLYKPTEGEIVFNGEDITFKKEKELKKLRAELAMVFQDAFSSMNPRSLIRDEIAEPVEVHHLAQSNAEVDQVVNEKMRLVGLEPSLKYRVPHELSGGQRQRISIARALASNPKVIICDEPISALDVSIQAQVINLLEDLQETYGLTYLFIAHDLAVVRHISDRIMVLYLGRVVEIAECEELYNNPLHPYSQMLLAAIPTANPFVEEERERIAIRGEIPSPMNRPKGCPFSNRCPYATEQCSQCAPSLTDAGNGHMVACYNYKNLTAGEAKE